MGAYTVNSEVDQVEKRTYFIRSLYCTLYLTLVVLAINWLRCLFFCCWEYSWDIFLIWYLEIMITRSASCLKPLSYTKTVSPICLPRLPDPVPGTTCVITGWGLVKGKGELATKLKEAEIKVRSSGSCMKHPTNLYLAPEEVCLGTTVNAS